MDLDNRDRPTLSRDPKALVDLWTDDGVLLEPEAQARVGKRIIGAEVEKTISEHSGMKVLSYEPEITELKVIDEWAFEWGYFSSSYKDSRSDQAKSFRGQDGAYNAQTERWHMEVCKSHVESSGVKRRGDRV